MLSDIRAACAILALVLPLVRASTGAAAQAPADRLRLADVLAIAREANPEIRAARSRARAAAARPAQARAWDDPVLSWEAWNAPENMNVADAENNIFKLAQKIPFP